jgi:small subunit ribosomal protein S4
MARYIGAVCKLCRREGGKLYLKGERCFSDKCSVTRRPYPPGQHGQGRFKMSEYGCACARSRRRGRIYGLLEKQFRGYYTLASAMKGRTGETMLGLLEGRLDNLMLRAGLASTRAQGRQLVRHNHVLVNGKRVNIPSYPGQGRRQDRGPREEPQDWLYPGGARFGPGSSDSELGGSRQGQFQRGVPRRASP